MRNKVFYVILLTLYCLTSISHAENIQFTVSYAGNNISTTINLYRDGERVKSQYTSSGSITFTECTGEYTYTSNTNHTGRVKAGENVRLECGLLKITVKDYEENPISSSPVYIYEDGDQIDSQYTDANGIVYFYLNPSIKYAYKTDYGFGAVELPAANIEKDITIKETFQVVAKYQNLPIYGQYSLYPYPMTDNAIQQSYNSKTSGTLHFSAALNQQYWIKDRYDIFSTPFTPTESSKRIFIEHYKVTFISNNEPELNILKTLSIKGISQSYSYGSQITDGKGYVVYYLQPGEYEYSYLGGSNTFTVGQADCTINISAGIKTLTFKNISGQPCPYLTFTVSDEKATNTEKYTTDANGVCQITTFSNETYVSINGLGKYKLSDEQDITIQTVQCSFQNKNFSHSAKATIYYNNSFFTITNGETKTLLPGAYTYNITVDSKSLQSLIPLNLTQDTVIADGQNMCAVTICVKDKNGNAVPGIPIYCYPGASSSFLQTAYTDLDGIVKFVLSDGLYSFKKATGEELASENVTGDMTVHIEVPTEIAVKINCNGVPYNGNFSFSQNMSNIQSQMCTDGIVKARIDNTSPIYVSLGNTLYFCKTTLSDNSTLNFVSANICAEGPGLSFPLFSNPDNETGKTILVGENLHLVAVPAAGAEFEYWDINGTHYPSAVIDYLVSDNIAAKAVFKTTTSKVSESFVNQIDIRVTDNTIYFDQPINGPAHIYSTSGLLVKSSYVVSDHMEISELSAGVYVLSVENTGNQYAAKFVKK